MYIGHVCLSFFLSVCLSFAKCLHYCTDPDVTLGNGRGCPHSCSLLGGFAIRARLSLLWQHTRLMRNISEDTSTHCMDSALILQHVAISLFQHEAVNISSPSFAARQSNDFSSQTTSGVCELCCTESSVRLTRMSRCFDGCVLVIIYL